ncbi:MAG TPA: hypothetical protein VHX37_14435 [Acidobacteriaceae bacterium]|jgi:hypothetical protein|nr:hypothetical protein [Acidobacteriaceae bacterium]
MVPSWHVVNTTIWILALVLQVALAAVVLWRGIPGNYPGFTALIVFYPLRAALPFALAGHTTSDAYEGWSAVLSLIGILLQAWLVVELAAHLMREMGGWNGRRFLIPPAIGALALACTWLTLIALPGRIEVDRAQTFFWWIMVGLAPLAFSRPRSPNLARICGGFAAFSLCQLLALAGRSHAWITRNSHAYVCWEYVPAGVYVAVVCYWMVFLKREERPIPQTAAVPS